ncbi:MAG: hypothetical protein GXO22_01275 [Aquificae bacterium]|nr:hypothetical protein [Aquificota bacterium]
MKDNNKGIALLTTLLLSVLAITIVAAFFFVLTRGTTISKQKKIYTSALEAAKGVSFVILNKIKEGTLECKNGTTVVLCTDTGLMYPADINLNIDGKDFSNLGDYTITAKLLSYKATATSEIFSVKVISIPTNMDKTKAEITFVVEIQ